MYFHDVVGGVAEAAGPGEGAVSLERGDHHVGLPGGIDGPAGQDEGGGMGRIHSVHLHMLQLNVTESVRYPRSWNAGCSDILTNRKSLLNRQTLRSRKTPDRPVEPGTYA